MARLNASPRFRQILLTFNEPKTPRQIGTELGIKKIKPRPLIKEGLIKPLTLERKCKFFELTPQGVKTAKQFNPLFTYSNTMKDWQTYSWINASPRQRFVILKVMDSQPLTSEQIRIRASEHDLSKSLTRTSTKGILKELVSKGLVETKMRNRKRYYWISVKGAKLATQLRS